MHISIVNDAHRRLFFALTASASIPISILVVILILFKDRLVEDVDRVGTSFDSEDRDPAGLSLEMSGESGCVDRRGSQDDLQIRPFVCKTAQDAD